MDPTIRKTEENLIRLSSDEETYRLYEAREHSRYERNSLIADGRAAGREEGKAEGKAEGKLEVARKLLLQNINPEIIMKATDLSPEELEEARRGMQ